MVDSLGMMTMSNPTDLLASAFRQSILLYSLSIVRAGSKLNTPVVTPLTEEEICIKLLTILSKEEEWKRWRIIKQVLTRYLQLMDPG